MLITTPESRIVRLLLIVTLVGIAALLGSPSTKAEEAGELQNPSFAERHSENRLPSNAIDTRSLPNIVLSAEAEDQPLPYYRLASDTYFLYGNIAHVNTDNRGFNGNAGFVVTADGVVVIDSLGTPELGRRMIATIREVTDQPIRYLILTHSHPDHAYGAAAFRALPAVTIIGHPGALDYLASETIRTSTEHREEILGEDMEGFRGIEPDKLIYQDRLGKPYRFELGAKVFEVYNVGRHHSHGDLIVYQALQEIVWISDLAFNQRVTFMGDGNSQQIIEGQKWLMERFADANLMVPGHGSAQTRPFPMVTQTHSYVQRLRAEMAEAIENNKSLSEAVNQSHFPEWEDVRLYEENHRRNASFVYLEMEQELF